MNHECGVSATHSLRRRASGWRHMGDCPPVAGSVRRRLGVDDRRGHPGRARGAAGDLADAAHPCAAAERTGQPSSPTSATSSRWRRTTSRSPRGRCCSPAPGPTAAECPGGWATGPCSPARSRTPCPSARRWPPTARRYSPTSPSCRWSGRASALGVSSWLAERERTISTTERLGRLALIAGCCSAPPSWRRPPSLTVDGGGAHRQRRRREDAERRRGA